MQIALISTALAIVLLLCFVWAIKTGLKIGLDLAKGNAPKVNINPVRAIQEHIEAKETRKETDKLMQGIENLFSYTGDKQREGEQD